MKIFHILFICLSLSHLLRATELDGIVLNASNDSTTVPGAKIFLQQLAPDAQAPTQIAETISAQNGTFSFELDAVNITSTYYISTDFQGVRYFSDGLSLTAKQSLSVKLVVHDSTHSADGVDAFMHRIIIADLGNALQIRETHVLNNPRGKTITQTLQDETVGPALFKFRVPAGATNFSPISAHSAQEMVQEGDYVFDRSIFLPGQKTISFSYEIAMSQKQSIIKANAAHNARTFDVFIGSKNLSVESDQLEDYDMFSISGTQYRRYGASNVDAGTDITFTVKRSGASVPQQTPTVALAVTSVLLLVGLFWTLNKKQQAESGTQSGGKDTADRRRQLIQEIAQLDIEKKPGGDAKRRRLMDELQNIEWQRLNASKKSRRRK